MYPHYLRRYTFRQGFIASYFHCNFFHNIIKANYIILIINLKKITKQMNQMINNTDI